MRKSVIGILLALCSHAASAATPVFECHRVNYAWGFAMAGKAIDADGNILSYSLRDKDLRPKPVYENGYTYFPAAQMNARFADAQNAGKVDTAKLAENIALIDKAALGKITTIDGGARDAGASSCHAYVFDAAKERYRDIELGSDGGVSDTKNVNGAPEAKTLIDWLKSVGVAH